MSRNSKSKTNIQNELLSPSSSSSSLSSSSNKDREISNQEDSNSSNKDQDISKMDERQKKLFQLRLKMNQGRKANKQEVEMEYKRMTDPNFDRRKYYESEKNNNSNNSNNSSNNNSNNSNKNEIKAGKSEGSFDVDVDAALEERKWKKLSKEKQILDVTSKDSQLWQEKQEKKEKNKAAFGWQAFTADASYRAYKKTLKHLPKYGNEGMDQEDQEASNDSNNVSNVLSLEDSLLTGVTSSSSVSKAALDRLGKHLEEKEEDRKKFSRRRMQFDSGDVDYINDDNAKFNKKIKKAFDKYTVEIRQNLERGTAV